MCSCSQRHTYNRNMLNIAIHKNILDVNVVSDLFQEHQMREFYDKIEERKEQQLQMDIERRKHHDTLL